jgi:hypothetical protein
MNAKGTRMTKAESARKTYVKIQKTKNIRKIKTILQHNQR